MLPLKDAGAEALASINLHVQILRALIRAGVLGPMDSTHLIDTTIKGLSAHSTLPRAKQAMELLESLRAEL